LSSAVPTKLELSAAFLLRGNQRHGGLRENNVGYENDGPQIITAGCKIAGQKYSVNGEYITTKCAVVVVVIF